MSQFANSVVGCDVDEECIAYASQKYQKANLTFQKNSITDLNFEDNSFDMVVSFETIEHIDEQSQHQALKEIKRILKPSGKFFVSTPFIDSVQHVKGNRFHKKEFYYDEFEKFLTDYFKNVKIVGQSICFSSVIGNCDKSIIGFNENLSKLNDKYIIAVCSDEPIEEVSSSVLLERNTPFSYGTITNTNTDPSFNINKSFLSISKCIFKILYNMIMYKFSNNDTYKEKINKYFKRLYN